ncbi:MAG: hypothetical protein ACREH4_10020 [Vitreimonas sp.]
MRALWLLSAAVALMACASPGARDDPSRLNAERLRACVSAAGAEREALERCTGVAASACIERSGQRRSAMCWASEARVWRELIGETSAHLNETQGHRSPALLASANEAWSAWAGAECAYWSGAGEQARCDAEVSAHRAIALIRAPAH